MSVVGFDVGNVNCYVSVARAGGIETVANEYSDRCTPAVVSFGTKQRFAGFSAKNQMVMNYKSTISQFKRFIGHQFHEPCIQDEISMLPYNTVKTSTGGVGCQVEYMGEAHVFNAQQIMAMLLNELKEIAQNNLQVKVNDCVISVPSYYTDYQRRCMLQAAHIAGLNCLKLMNDTSAVALNYGLFKQDLPGPEEKQKHVVFVDMGHSSYQVCIASFVKGKIKVLSTASDNQLGGRNFDRRLQHYFANEFLKKYKIDARKNPRAWLRLGNEVEKIKKQMSTNSTDLPINIECFMEDKDVVHKINRDEFEGFCQDLYDRVEKPLRDALQLSGLKNEDIDVVELVGGSMRMPAVKKMVEKVLNKPCSTTLNLDEAVARGCAIQCAMLSHTVKVRDIEVMDATCYPITLSWPSIKTDELPGEMVVFKQFHSYPFTKMLTFPHRIEPFQINAYYGKEVAVPTSEEEIGIFSINATPPPDCIDTNKTKVKVKVRLDVHGCFTVSCATMVESLPPPSPEPEKDETMETVKKEEVTEASIANEAKADKPTETPQTNGEVKDDVKKEEDKKPEVKKPKKSTKSTELCVSKQQYGLSVTELNLLLNVENELTSQVLLETRRAEAKNAVEEYVYDMRDNINSRLASYIRDSEKEEFLRLLSQTEDWLYDEGEDQLKQVYVDKLAELKVVGQPVVDRFTAYEELPSALETLGRSITHYRKVLDKFSQKDEQYIHIDASEMKKVEKKVEEKFTWFNKKMQLMGNYCKYETPKVFPSNVLAEVKLLQDFCDPIVNKPKPKVEPPKNDSKKENEENMEQSSEQPESTTEHSNNNDMEVD